MCLKKAFLSLSGISRPAWKVAARCRTWFAVISLGSVTPASLLVCSHRLTATLLLAVQLYTEAVKRPSLTPLAGSEREVIRHTERGADLSCLAAVVDSHCNVVAVIRIIPQTSVGLSAEHSAWSESVKVGVLSDMKKCGVVPTTKLARWRWRNVECWFCHTTAKQLHCSVGLWLQHYSCKLRWPSFAGHSYTCSRAGDLFPTLGAPLWISQFWIRKVGPKTLLYSCSSCCCYGFSKKSLRFS